MNVFVISILASLAVVLPGLNELPPRPIPPAEYQQSNVTTVVFVGDPDDVDAFCKAALHENDPSIQLVGCEGTLKKNKGKVIAVENPCLYPDDRYARHVCHELGHVNGWPSDHPNAQ